MKHTLSTLEALTEEVSSALMNTPDVPTAILAGHQILAKNGEYSKVMGILPEATWTMGIRILEAVRGKMKRVHIFTVINDWAELRGVPNPEELREIYWENPQYELKESENPIYAPHILPALGYEGEITKGRFSEKALQNRFSRLFPKTSEACDRPSCEYSFNKCSSEVVMLVRELYKQGIRRLMAFMPNMCTGPISYASHALAQGDYRLSDGVLDEGFLIENVYLNSFKPKTAEDVLLKQQHEKIEIPSRT